MIEIDNKLYDFIIANKCSLMNEWLDALGDKSALFYASRKMEQAEDLWREEDDAFIGIISRVLIKEHGEYFEELEHWVSTTASAGARNSVPLHLLVSQLGMFRRIYWSYVKKFFEEEPSATSRDALEWSESINDSFDYIIGKFTVEHHKAHEKMLKNQQLMINELSSPVIPIKQGIAILPLVGDIDTHRAKVILETALEESAKQKLHTLFIDLSAVAIIDTMVAQQIFQLMTSLRLIGVRSVLSGIRPEIAQTAISLGLDFQGIEVHANLMRALEVHA